MKRIEILLFVFAWTTYGYFCQGGGWNQNGRFALTRAIVEERKPWIDDYVVYAAAGTKGSPTLRRVPVRNGGFTDEGRSFALGWDDGSGAATALAPDAPAEAKVVHAGWAAVTGDLAYARGHVHPNKAPGGSFAAAPGYALLWGMERLAGIDIEAARVLSLNAWLTGALSVGLIAAMGVVVFYRLALRLSAGATGPALFATLAFAFGSFYFPYATMLYEHDVAAVLLLAALSLALEAAPIRRLAAAGACAGAAVVASYLSIVGAAILGGYVVWRARRFAAALAFALGMIPPLALLAAYNLVGFGTILTTNYAFENPLFKRSGAGWLGVLTTPDFKVLLALLASPLRGLFFGAPVLVIGAIGLILMLRQPRWRAEAVVCLALIGHVLIFNMSFAAWDGGWSCGPRYLIPALPFLALPIVFVRRAAWIRHALLGLSIAAMAIATTVDPQPPVLSSGPWTISPIWSIDLPQFVEGHPGAYATEHWPDSYLALYTGPVSVNPAGIYEAIPGRFYAADSPQLAWSSFNAGELVLSGRASVIPWLLLAAGFAVWVRRAQRPV